MFCLSEILPHDVRLADARANCVSLCPHDFTSAHGLLARAGTRRWGSRRCVMRVLARAGAQLARFTALWATRRISGPRAHTHATGMRPGAAQRHGSARLIRAATGTRVMAPTVSGRQMAPARRRTTGAPGSTSPAFARLPVVARHSRPRPGCPAQATAVSARGSLCGTLVHYRRGRLLAWHQPAGTGRPAPRRPAFCRGAPLSFFPQ